MSTEPESIRVPSTKEPSVFNRGMAAGFGAGLLVPFIPFTPLIGAAIGGFMEKSKLEHEKEHGHEVTKPTLWNKDLLTGAGLGSLASMLVVPLVTAALAVAAVGAPAVAVGALAAYVGSVALGGLIGGALGKSRMEKEWKDAKEYVATHGGEYQGRTIEMAKAIQPQVTQNIYVATPEEVALLQQKQAELKQKGFAAAHESGTHGAHHGR